MFLPKPAQNCTKSSDQGMLQSGSQAACRRIKLVFIRLFAGLFARISGTTFVYNQAIKVKFCLSKVFIPVANGSTGTMRVTLANSHQTLHQL